MKKYRKKRNILQKKPTLILERCVNLMKKWITLLLSLCLLLGMVSCEDRIDLSETEQTKEKNISSYDKEMVRPGGACRFTAEIRAITDAYLEVCTEDENMCRTASLFRVSVPEGVDVKSFAVGDTVEIVFAGAIQETYPAGITDTVSIALWHCGLTEE